MSVVRNILRFGKYLGSSVWYCFLHNNFTTPSVGECLWRIPNWWCCWLSAYCWNVARYQASAAKWTRSASCGTLRNVWWQFLTVSWCNSWAPPLKMGQTGYSETSLRNFHHTIRHVPEERMYMNCSNVSRRSEYSWLEFLLPDVVSVPIWLNFLLALKVPNYMSR
jgi:hypothetical protein